MLKKSLKNIVIFLFVAMFILNGTSLIFAQQESNTTNEEISGKIISVDPAKPNLVIREYPDADTQIYNDTALLINESTLVERNYEKVDFEELVIGENVDVEYSINDEGNKVASYISVKSKE